MYGVLVPAFHSLILDDPVQVYQNNTTAIFAVHGRIVEPAQAVRVLFEDPASVVTFFATMRRPPGRCPSH